MSDKHTPDREDGRYPQIVRMVRETPWAILPSTLAAIVDFVGRRAAGEDLSDEEIQTRIGAGPPSRDNYRRGAVAVIPVYGVITPRATLLSQISGGTSVQGLQQAFRYALADTEISSILLDVHSPGGMTDLIPEIAAEIRAARGRKPIVAVANTVAASAAYWIASQADELVVTPSGEVGSIGVFAAHDDISGMQEKLGVKTTLISAGKYKTEGNPFEPLSDEAKQAIQQRVDEFYGMFVADVAAGRGVSEETVRGGFGQGRMVGAKQAVEQGMADRVDTFEGALRRVAAVAPDSGGASAAAAGERPEVSDGSHRDLSFTEQVEVARRAISTLEARARTLRVLTAAKQEQLATVVAACDALEQLLTEAPEESPDDALEIEANVERQLARLRS